ELAFEVPQRESLLRQRGYENACRHLTCQQEQVSCHLVRLALSLRILDFVAGNKRVPRQFPFFGRRHYVKVYRGASDVSDRRRELRLGFRRFRALRGRQPPIQLVRQTLRAYWLG